MVSYDLFLNDGEYFFGCVVRRGGPIGTTRDSGFLPSINHFDHNVLKDFSKRLRRITSRIRRYGKIKMVRISDLAS